MTVPTFTYHWPYHTFRAMGTQIKLWIEADEAPARAGFAEIESLFRDVEAALSRFNPTSELSLLNARAGEWVSVSKTLWSVLKLALAYASETQGLFDPTILNALKSAGYRETFDLIGYGGTVEPQPVLAWGNWQSVELDEPTRSVKLPAGIGLDFGGIAKGHTAQWAVRILGLWGPCLVDAGGDLAAGDAPLGLAGWPVRLFAPRINGQPNPRPLVGLNLANSALATSGIDHRAWKVGGRRAHHLIDPRTDQPADTNIVTASVKASSGALAEVMTKVAMINGLGALPELTAQHLPALMVSADSSLHLNAPMMPLITGVDPDAAIYLHAAGHIDQVDFRQLA